MVNRSSRISLREWGKDNENKEENKRKMNRKKEKRKMVRSQRCKINAIKATWAREE